MAVVARVATGNVREVFADGDDAVMTAAAGPDNLRVINTHYGRKYIGRVAVLAHIGRLDVCCILACGINAVVTAHAIARDVYVIKIRR